MHARDIPNDAPTLDVLAWTDPVIDQVGYDIATSVPDIDDDHLLRPRTLYAAQDREEEYREIVATLIEERRRYFDEYPALDARVRRGA